MKNYEQVLETVELALTKGEYHFCIEFLSPLIDSYPTSSKEGINLRTILITALCGINKKEDAKKICRELLKSYDYKTRENAKYLMEVIDSPDIKKPENWNINFENKPEFNNKSFNPLKSNRNNLVQKKFINTTNSPTGETKPFQKGFAFTIFLILLLLIPLLSGCVKIENTLDISSPDSINNHLKIESKYIDKFPWQIKFEESIQAIYPNSEISINESDFSLKNKNLSIKNMEELLKNIQFITSDFEGRPTDLKFTKTEKNFILFKKYFYKIYLDLRAISDLEDLELNFEIIYPNQSSFTNADESQLKVSKNFIDWNLIPGEINILEFSINYWNKLLISISFISLLIILSFLLRFYRFQLGSDLPQLPPN